MTTVRRPLQSDDVTADDVIDRLRLAGHTVGRTRRTVLAAVRKRRGAFTAEDLAGDLDDVHVATVYRTLALLEEIGYVQHVHLSHGPALYERSAEGADVRHLVCEECGRHVAVPVAVFDAASRRLADEFEFVLHGSHFAIVGRCRACFERATA